MKTIKKYQPPNLGESKLTSGFWFNRTENYMHIIQSMENTLLDDKNAARLINFAIAAGEAKGAFYRNDWSDGDCYKFIEGCANQYAVTGDQRITDLMEPYIPWIEKAQEHDGYINTQITLTHIKRWEDPKHHELYNLGHLFTAGVTYYEATGDKRLLDVAIKAADNLCTVFLPINEELADFGFNPSQIMGLMDLYDVIGNEDYLTLADTFITMRGMKPTKGDFNQNRVPLREESKPVGHAVMAAYLYAGAADVYGYTQDKTLFTSLERIWQDMISKRIYITGGVCPLYSGISERGDNVHEAFGDEYDLPHRIAYNETCANIGIAMWARRMYNLTGEATYGDWMENILYNAGISGASLDMTSYFYANPLAHRAKEHIKPTFNQYAHVPNKRFKTFTCWCCPPQLWRTFSGMPRWVYAVSDKGVSINLFTGCELDTKLRNGEPVKVVMKTNYPWDKEVVIMIEQAPTDGMTLQYRIPSWCSKAKVNGHAKDPGVYEAVVKTGDKITLQLPMEAVFYEANPMVEQANGMVAVKRGPVVYCLEGHDIEGAYAMDELALSVEEGMEEVVIDELPYEMIGIKTHMYYKPKGQGLYHPRTPVEDKKVPVRLIPYFAWANRSEEDMSVWLNRA